VRWNIVSSEVRTEFLKIIYTIFGFKTLRYEIFRQYLYCKTTLHTRLHSTNISIAIYVWQEDGNFNVETCHHQHQKHIVAYILLTNNRMQIVVFFIALFFVIFWLRLSWIDIITFFSTSPSNTSNLWFSLGVTHLKHMKHHESRTLHCSSYYNNQ
jgi:hypothetical protein